MKPASIIPFALFVYLSACGSDSPNTSLECGDGVSQTVAPGETLTVSASGDALSGAAVTSHATADSRTVDIHCNEDPFPIPDGYAAVSPVIEFSAEDPTEERHFGLALPIRAALMPSGSEYRHLQILVKRKDDVFFLPAESLWVDDSDKKNVRVLVQDTWLSTYQVVVSQDAGQPVDRTFQYRAMIGISMGGDAALNLGLKHHDKFDFVASLGGEPGPSKRYALTAIFDNLFGGFCTTADQAAGLGDVGELCPKGPWAELAGQFPLTSDFEHMLYQEGSGVGLTLSRSLYQRAARDLSRAYGNPTSYNSSHAYVPAGVPSSYIYETRADQCNNPVVLDDFYDREFNPEGTASVITFCDGADLGGSRRGDFNPMGNNNNPWQVLLAVDLNGNQVRDSGEPVIVSSHEPFEDVGIDGLPDAMETGYDAVTNPDPAGDNYHYSHNPMGTERNYRYDDGEPYEDVGLDGVMGTCQQGDTPPNGIAACYDWGEGDGQWSLSPNLASWYEKGLYNRFENIPVSERGNTNVWLDAGIRDFLNAHISANIGISQLQTDFGQPVGLYNGFHGLTGQEFEQLFDFSEMDWSRIPTNVYVRYGNPDASEEQITAGDGRHVGSASQVVQRFATPFAWVSHHWPGGDKDPDVPPGELLEGLTFTSPTTGRETPFGLFLPPGYDDPSLSDMRYPVIYFFHGYGQDPNDLVAVSAIFENYMVTPNWTEEQRFQKFIIVYVDGRCRPGESGVPVTEGSGDECERGTFYLDSPLNTTSKMETHLLELVDFIDSNYRTKQPETVSIIP